LEEVERRMREVLLALAMTSNGRTASFNSSGGSEPDYTPTLGRGDAPHLFFAAAWDAAEGDDARRRRLLQDAQETLKHLLRSSGDPGRVESKADRDARIVEHGEGVAARDVATRFRCGIRDVWNARHEAGRDIELGRRPRNGRELPADARRAEVHRLAADGVSARQIAVSLQLSESTVRRDLGTKA
jgi:ATP/maltotriose-dependent transcriptional regulator MalT